MGLIQKVLHFEFCPRCGKHGHFVTPGPASVTGAEVYSKMMAFAHLDIILTLKMADEVEVELARQVIRASHLPDLLSPHDLKDALLVVGRAYAQQPTPTSSFRESCEKEAQILH